jgi:hypothetical protein
VNKNSQNSRTFSAYIGGGDVKNETKDDHFNICVHITLVISITGSILAVKLNCMDIFLLYIVIDHDIVLCYLIHVERR